MRNTKAAAVLAVLALTGCASRNPSVPGTHARQEAHHSAPAKTVRVGATYRIPSVACGDAVMTVKLEKVIDPATGTDAFSAAPPGSRLVAAVFRLQGVTGAASDDANSAALLVGADGQDYQATYGPVAGYTNFSSGQFTLSPGAASVGAVVFVVPGGVKVAGIQWTGCLEIGNPAQWQVK